jgi:hypothetical protein
MLEGPRVVNAPRPAHGLFLHQARKAKEPTRRAGYDTCTIKATSPVIPELLELWEISYDDAIPAVGSNPTLAATITTFFSAS